MLAVTLDGAGEHGINTRRCQRRVRGASLLPRSTPPTPLHRRIGGAQVRRQERGRRGEEQRQHRSAVPAATTLAMNCGSSSALPCRCAGTSCRKRTRKAGQPRMSSDSKVAGHGVGQHLVRACCCY